MELDGYENTKIIKKEKEIFKEEKEIFSNIKLINKPTENTSYYYVNKNREIKSQEYIDYVK